MNRFTPADLSGDPCYLLEITWGGRVFRFSTKPIDISDTDGTVYPFEGGLDDPDFSEQSDRAGFSDSGPSIPIGVLFPVDIAEEASNDNHLDSATGVLALVFLDDISGQPLQAYEQRFILATGGVSLPVYADPDDVPGWATFTLESPVSDDLTTLIPDGSVISLVTWPNAPDASLGKVYPTVIGSPGTYTDSTGTAQTVPGTPAYLVGTDKLLVAGHNIKGGTLTIYDEDGTTYSTTATTERDKSGNGQVCAVVDISGAGAGFAKSGASFHVAWPTDGGGLLDPISGDLLERLGDVAVWALSRGRSAADVSSWIALSPLLRSITLAGYCNNAEITIYEWLRDEIFNLVPLEVRQGPQGVYPLLHRTAVPAESALAHIEEGGDFEPISAVTTQTEPHELRNEISLRFAIDDDSAGYQRTIRIGAGIDTDDVDFRNSPDATISQDRYGRRVEALTSDYLYNTASAGAVLKMRMRAMAYPTRTRTYLADAAYGWLNVGDFITLTSSSLYFTEKLVEISRKRWTGTAWQVDVSWNADPAR